MGCSASATASPAMPRPATRGLMLIPQNVQAHHGRHRDHEPQHPAADQREHPPVPAVRMGTMQIDLQPQQACRGNAVDQGGPDQHRDHPAGPVHHHLHRHRRRQHRQRHVDPRQHDEGRKGQPDRRRRLHVEIDAGHDGKPQQPSEDQRAEQYGDDDGRHHDHAADQQVNPGGAGPGGPVGQGLPPIAEQFAHESQSQCLDLLSDP